MAIALVAAAACAPAITVSSHVQRDLDLSTYETYDWGPADALPSGDARLDDNPLFADYVHGAIERELAARGLELDGSGNPDLLVHYHASVSDRIDVNRVDRDQGYCATVDDCPVETYHYESGTLVVDIVDAGTKKLVWRGWAQSALDAFLDDPDRMSDTVNESISRMMNRLPAARTQ